MQNETFQARVNEWMIHCFGEAVTTDNAERCHRFIEEALELVQSFSLPKADVLMLVDYVYSRPVGDPFQEMGGTMVTLAALATCQYLDMDACGAIELRRIWGKVEQIRNKQLTKPKNSPLPQ